MRLLLSALLLSVCRSSTLFIFVCACVCAAAAAQDWWNATSYLVYYRKWNLLVGDWLFNYVYSDAQKDGRSRTFSLLLTFGNARVAWLARCSHGWRVAVRLCAVLLCVRPTSGVGGGARIHHLTRTRLLLYVCNGAILFSFVFAEESMCARAGLGWCVCGWLAAPLCPCCCRRAADPVMFVLFLGAGVFFIYLTDLKRGNPAWNIFFWTTLIIGNGILMVLYSREWHARHHPSEGYDTNSWLPWSWQPFMKGYATTASTASAHLARP